MDIKEKLKSIPDLPGSYQFKNKDGVIIYVGKAKSLKKRVSSYFTGSHDTKTSRLVMHIADIEYKLLRGQALLEAWQLDYAGLSQAAVAYMPVTVERFELVCTAAE